MANRVPVDTEDKVADRVGYDRPVANAPAPKRRSGPTAKWAVVLVVLVLLAAAAYFGYQRYFANRESTDDAQVDGHIYQVSSKVSGMVQTVYIDDNQQVKAGEVLVQIDPRDYQVALDRAKGDLAAAQAGARAAETQIPLTSATTANQIGSAQASVDQAEGLRTAAMRQVDTAKARRTSAEARLRETEANYTKTVQDLERMKLLVSKDEISRQQYDAAVAAADAAKAARDSAQASVEETGKAIEAAQAGVVQANARVQEARAALQTAQTAPQQVAITHSNAQSAQARAQQAGATQAQAELNLSYTSVTAPVDGIVSQRRAEPGHYVQSGQPLMAVVPLKGVWVTANYKESQLKNMQPKQKAEFSVDAYGGRVYQGHVDSIAAATGARFSLLPPENATGNYVKVVQRIPVKIVIDGGIDAEHPLRPGMSVVATVYTK
jgi:membrane fusion protein, multidrug efflux system